MNEIPPTAAATRLEQVSGTADQVVISVNPRAGAASSQVRVTQLTAALGAVGLRTQVTTQLEAIQDIVGPLIEQGRLRALVGIGGDGTAAEMLNRTAPGTPLAILPAGTENLLARYLGLSADPLELAQTIRRGLLLRLDAGCANGRLFQLMVSCGFDAEVVRRLHGSRTGHIRRWSYAKPILEAIRSYSYPELRVYCAQGSDEWQPCEPWGVARWAFAFNLPCYGGGLRLAPLAEGMDGELDVLTFRRGSLLHGLNYTASVFMGRHLRLADCQHTRTARMRIEADEPVPYQVDGDPGGMLPLELHVQPARLSVLVPEQTIRQRFPKLHSDSP